MSLTNSNSLSKGDNDSLNTLNVNITSTESSMRRGVSVGSSRTNSRSTQIESLVCNDRGLNTKFDIDFGYAINLLKKEDQSINVYNHLQGILDKISYEKPSNPLENFEKYSQQLKRTYIRKDDNFERIFVDNIDRNNCQRNLKIYKCALKNQLEQQKQYNINKKSSKKAGNVKGEKNKTADNVHGANVQVQNLFEVNMMFNKAGCGLPLDEVTLISISMYEMARLKKFKKIRFWGKIFGIKRMYFIIECESTDAELNRKSLKGDLDKMSSADDKTGSDASVVAHVNASQKSHLSESNAENRSGATVKTTQSSFDSDVTAPGSKTIDDASKSSDSWTSPSKNCSYETIPEVQVPPEAIGTGANRRVYFVTNELSNSKWIELDSVRPHQIVGARRIKRYFTGKLNQPINSFPKFKGTELDYLRAQIARISSSTQICPRGYYVFNSKASTQDNMSDNTIPSLDSLDMTEKNNFDLIPNISFKPTPNKDMINLNNWVHTNPRIENTGITNSNYPGASTPSQQHFESFNEMDEYDEGKENLNFNGELFGNLSNDFAVGNKPAWKGVVCSPFNSRYSYTAMMSHIWPGAYAVVDQFKTVCVYIGWAQKQDYSECFSNLMTGLGMETFTKESQTEFEEVVKKQITDVESQLSISLDEYMFEEVDNEFNDEFNDAAE